MKKILSLLLVALMLVGMLPMMPINASAATGNYVKVTAAPDDWSGEYLIVYESEGLIFNGSLTKLDAVSNTKQVTITDGVISGDYTAYSFTINADGVVRSNSGYSIGQTSNANGLKTSTSTNYTNTITFNADGTVNFVSAGAYLRYNASSDQTRFRYYKSSTYSAQKAICLYKLQEDSGNTDCQHTNTTVVAEIPAQCEEIGYTAGVQCTACEDWVSGHEAIPATGHNYGDWSVVTAATCTEAGEQTHACQNEGCDKTETETIPAMGHNYVDGTCTGCGNVAVMTVYELVTDAASLKAGDQLIFVGADADGAYSVMIPYASGNNLKAESITAPVDGKISLADTSAAAIITLGGDSTAWTLFDGAKYLYAAGGTSSNHLKGVDALPTDNTGAWTIVIDEAGVATITSVGNTGDGARNTVKFNYGNSPVLFSCYKVDYATNVNLVSIYRLSDGTTEEPACEHTNTTTTTVDATCGKAGSITVVCDDCGETVSSEEIAALEHSYVDDVCVHCGAEFEGEMDENDPTEPAGSYELATYISVGDSVILVTENTDASFKKEFSGFLTKATYGDGADYTDVPAGVYVLTVCEGTAAGTFAFQTTDGKYLNYSGSNNTLNAVADLSANTSWTVNIDKDGYANISNVAETTRQIWWNVNNPRFACYTDKTLESTGYYGTKLYKYVAAGACEHQWGDWVETTAPTCTTVGVETATCILCSESKTQSIPAKGHSLVYDGETAFACSECDYKESFTLSTIAEVNAAGLALAYEKYSTDVYYAKGIVTYISGKNVYLEDATGGFCVYFSTVPEGIALGDEYLVWDKAYNYNGLIEFSGTAPASCIKVSSDNELPIKTVTIAELLADTTNSYLGERVQIEGVRMGVLGTNNTALYDDSNKSINIYKAPTLAEEVTEEDIVNVVAVVSAYKGTYQLVINPGTAATDVVVVENREPIVLKTVTIATAKAGEIGKFYQVEGTVTYISGRNVYIQDATGGIVVYLAANAATTKVGDNIRAYGALKSYNGLLELDGVDETNSRFYEIKSNDNTVDAQAVTIEGLLADTTNEYLAEKVTLTGVYVSYHKDYSSKYDNVTYVLNDGKGNTIELYRVPVDGSTEDDCLSGGTIIDVTAVVSAYVEEDTEGNGYQLLTSLEDISVTGTCAHETTELVNVKEATLTEVGYTGDRECTVCGNYAERGTETDALTDVEGWSLTLSDNILANFKIELDASVVETAQIKITVADKEYTYAAKDYYADGYCVVSAAVAAAQMTDSITVQIVNGDDVANSDKTYTIKGYAEEILSGEYDDNIKALVTAMLHYGAAAQTYFGYNDDNMANAVEGLAAAADPDLTQVNVADLSVSGSAEGIRFYGASLVFQNKIAVRFYFAGEAGEIEGAVQAGNLFYIEKANINPQDLDEAVTVTIGELSVSYSPMNYIVRMAAKGNANLTALVKALYNYNVAAEVIAPDAE